MTYTTLQQAKELIKLGLESKSADLVYCIRREDCTIPWEEAAKDEKNVLLQLRPFNDCLSDYALPCWSAEALLEILPDVIYTNDMDYYLYIWREDTKWYIQYIYSFDIGDELAVSEGGELINSLFKIIVWLLTNKLI